MRRTLGGLWPLVVPVAVAAVVWSCKPAPAPPDAAAHDKAACEVCRHPNGRRDVAHDLIVGAERHLELCAECREAGYTPADLIAMGSPTPCLVGKKGDAE